MQSIEELYSLFEQYRLENKFVGSITPLYAPANYLMDLGGKRMRPLLVLMAHQLYHQNITKSMTAALAVEVFHNFSLMHDDIMDTSPLRRGKPTVHIKYGINAAILSGDWMLIHTYQLLNKYDHKMAADLIHLMNTTAVAVCEGQQSDIDFESIGEVSESDYLRMIENKTAVLLAASLQMGGIIAGASDLDCKSLFQCGLNMGISFQLRDDYLDAFGDDSGKIKGGDILRNKKTLLYIHCIKHLNDVERVSLSKLYLESNEDKVEKTIAYFEKTQSDKYVQNLAMKYGDLAMNALDNISVSDQNKTNLRALFLNLLQRNS